MSMSAFFRRDRQLEPLAGENDAQEPEWQAQRPDRPARPPPWALSAACYPTGRPSPHWASVSGPWWQTIVTRPLAS